MNVLITGGAGFIGSHLADALLTRGEEVFVIDDLSSGSIANIEHLLSDNRFHYTIDTILNKPLMADLIDRCECIFHCAAAVGVRLIVEQPVKTISTNIKGTELCLELAAEKKKKVIFTSTSEVYGKSTRLPFNENDDIVLGPTVKSRWSYACSKAIDEFLAIAYHREQGLPLVITRLFNIVGPRQTGRYGMVFPRLITQALSGHNLTVYGTGKQTRSFLDISDCIEALMAVRDREECVGEVINIGSNREVSIAGLAERIIAVTHSSAGIIRIPYEKVYEEGFEDMERRAADTAKLRALTGISPRIELDEMIRRTAEYLGSVWGCGRVGVIACGGIGVL